MCRELRALHQSIDAYARAFDPRSLTNAQAGEVVGLCTQIEARVEAIRTLAAAVHAEGSSHQGEGYRSPEERLARTTGMSPSRAKRMLRTGRRLLEQPQVEQAALAGRLSPEQTEAVAAGAEADGTKAQELIDAAGDTSLAELHQEVAKVRAGAADLEARRQRIHAHRRLNTYTDLEGVFHLQVEGNTEDGLTMDQVLTEIRRKLTTNRRDLDIPNEKMATMDYDALVALFNIAHGRDCADITLADLLEIGLFPQLDVTDPSSSARVRPPVTSEAAGDETEPVPAKASPRKWLAGRPVKVIVRIDQDTLLRGYPLDGEICDIPGYGPIPVSLVHDLMRSGQAMLATVLTKQHTVSGVYLPRRRPNAYQETALDWLYPTCAVKGCNVRRGLQADHRDDWAKTHYTAVDLLDYLCYFHHSQKTNEGWALVAGTGKRHFVPPSDPRHPRHQADIGPPEAA